MEPTATKRNKHIQAILRFLYAAVLTKNSPARVLLDVLLLLCESSSSTHNTGVFDIRKTIYWPEYYIIPWKYWSNNTALSIDSSDNVGRNSRSHVDNK